ncbi:protein STRICTOSIDINE SYNTHASE-LIKE 10-like [Panicum miliaceum]|uniref:Protein STRICTOSIDINE SYNTHASE-LIKE 10-like n=1 Tax=Panicum miliaceum TaxID=4540 RepID=A0A3L6QG64_PANMI|nr:protein STRICTOSIDINE SYNTHASE-LIKE 10-like [Panicum miliaceum]
MGFRTKLPQALITSCLVAVLLLLLAPCGAAARPVPQTAATIDGSRSQHLPLRGSLLRGPESVAFDGAGAGPYSGVSDGRVLRWNGQARGWST